MTEALLNDQNVYWILWLNTLLHELGVPVPMTPTALVAGARAVTAGVNPVLLVLAIVVAMTIGNAAWFAAGRRYGSAVLKLLCRVSLSPDTCVARTLAADAPHALHMPSHIFTRVGAWRESIEANAVSAKAGSDKTFDKWHAYDYMVYAHLQLAQEAAARQIIREAQSIPTKVDNFPLAYAYGAMPARFALERGAWAEAAKLELTPAPSAFAWNKYPHAEAVTVFARGVGAASSKDAAQARAELARLLQLRDAANALKLPYWPGQIEIQADVVRGLATIAEGKADEGIEILRQAAAREDATEKHVVTPGPLLPAREVLAGALLDAGKSADAVREYEAVLTKEPNRLRATAGAALAAERSGDAQKARLHYAKVLELAAAADSPRPEVTNAKRYLGRS